MTAELKRPRRLSGGNAEWDLSNRTNQRCIDLRPCIVLMYNKQRPQLPPRPRRTLIVMDDDDKDSLYVEEDELESGFAISGDLDAPQAFQYTTRQLHTLIHEGIIDLSPPYQRGTCQSLS